MGSGRCTDYAAVEKQAFMIYFLQDTMYGPEYSLPFHDGEFNSPLFIILRVMKLSAGDASPPMAVGKSQGDKYSSPHSPFYHVSETTKVTS